MAYKVPYMIGLACVVISFVLCLIGFGTGYWFVSQDPDNLFQSIGLWQACFNGYEHTTDLIGKAYHGCWWLFYYEYYYIRDWIMPPWFKSVQTLMTFAVVFQFILIALYPMGMTDTNNTRVLSIICVIAGILCILLIIPIVTFGVMIGLDRTWMPRWDKDCLGWSYGLVVLSGFFSLFALINITVYTLLKKYELYKYREGGLLSGAQGYQTNAAKV